MKNFLAASLILLASAAAAATPLENAVDLAARLGVQTQTPAPASAIETPSSAFAPRTEAPLSDTFSVFAYVSGGNMLFCSGGWFNGSVHLRGSVAVRTKSGATGNIPVDGTYFAQGSCRQGSGYLSGGATVDGAGTLYKDGRPVGSARVSGRLSFSRYVSGSYLQIDENVFFSGSSNEPSL